MAAAVVTADFVVVVVDIVGVGVVEVPGTAVVCTFSTGFAVVAVLVPVLEMDPAAVLVGGPAVVEAFFVSGDISCLLVGGAVDEWLDSTVPFNSRLTEIGVRFFGGVKVAS